MSYSQRHSSSQGNPFGGIGDFSQANPSVPSYPQRPDSYFGGSSSHSRQPLRTGSGSAFRDSHEMTNSPGGPRQVAKRNEHAFGDEDSDSDDSDEGQGFNVYNDFNNKGARYSAALSSADAYRDHTFESSPTGLSSKADYVPASTSPQRVDLVSAPQIGKDWNNQEARKDRKWEGKTKQAWPEKREGFVTGWSTWVRGERKVCGWFGWRQGIFFTFGFIVALAIVLYFVIPRVPGLAYNNQNIMTGDSNTTHFSRTPTNFSFNAIVNLALDGRNSWIPVHVTDIEVTVNDLGSSSTITRVGSGKLGSLTTSHKSYVPMEVPLKFAYETANTTDAIWVAWYDACAHIWPGNSSRPTLQISIEVEFKVTGLIGTKGQTTQLNGVSCPVEMSATGA